MANGKPFNQEQFASFASYVMQNDILLDTLTPREAFQFVANLRYSNEEEKKQRVSNTLRMLKLDRCADTLVSLFFLLF